MPHKSLSMRKIKEILRLNQQGLSNREIGRICRISHTTVSNYLLRLDQEGLSWPLPDDLNDADLERRLFPPPAPRRPALKPLPREPYEFAEWKKVRVHSTDYHVEFDRHWYSVPCALVGIEIELRVTRNTVECLHKGRRVASHRRSWLRGRHTTVPEHMPEKHRKVGEWSPERIVAWAGKAGPDTAALVKKMMDSRQHPQQAFRAVSGHSGASFPLSPSLDTLDRVFPGKHQDIHIQGEV